MLNSYNQKEVIYLVCSPLSSRDFERFGIQNWIDRGWSVQIFDITSFLFPKFWSYVDGNKLSVDFEGLKIFYNFEDLISVLENLKKKIVFIDMLGNSNKEISIRKIIKKHGILIKIKLGSIPRAQNKKNIWDLLSLLKHPIKLLYKSTSFVKNIYKQIISKKYYPDYVVVGGTTSIKEIDLEKTSIIKAHNYDYDFFIKKEPLELNKNSNFLVFLDEDGPYHSDFSRLGIEPFVTSKNYFPIIDDGLEKISNILKLNIKIAAHPRSNYSKKNIKYKHDILENKTFELIKEAKIVVAHCSTALQWAIIMKKPIILVTTNEIEQASYSKIYLKLIKEFSRELGKKTLNINDLTNFTKLEDYLFVDDEKYEKYIERYVKIKDSPKKLAWDIVIESIEKDIFLKKFL